MLEAIHHIYKISAYIARNHLINARVHNILQDSNLYFKRHLINAMVQWYICITKFQLYIAGVHLINASIQGINAIMLCRCIFYYPSPLLMNQTFFLNNKMFKSG